jgi:hypothetical protein
MLTHQVTWTTAAEGFPRPQRSHSEGSHYGFEENQQILGNMLKTWDIWGKKGGKFKKITHAATHTYVSASRQLCTLLQMHVHHILINTNWI